MVEGGAGNNAGAAMTDLADELRSNYGRHGIHVDTPDNDELWRLLVLQMGAVRKKVGSYRSAGYNPVVIVGHSMGACAAYEFANLIRTALVVTLDPVCEWGDGVSKDRYYPRPELAQRWIHVWLKGNFLMLPDWVGPRHNADKNLHLWNDHGEVRKMYSRVSQDVQDALSCSGRRNLRFGR